MPHQDAIRTLIEEEDPNLRIDAHMLLGRRALNREDEDSALSHFREAADLDPTDERPRTALLEMEGASTRKKPARSTFLRWLFTGRKAEA